MTKDILSNRLSEEELRKEQVRKEASQLHAEMKNIDGPTALVMIVDDNFNKQMLFEDIFTEPNLVTATAGTGEDALAIYTAFREQDNQDNQSSIIIVLDGQLAEKNSPFATGIQVAHSLAKVSEKNDWQIPFFVGASTDTYMNTLLRESFSEKYLATIDPTQDMQTAKDAISSKRK